MDCPKILAENGYPTSLLDTFDIKKPLKIKKHECKMNMKKLSYEVAIVESEKGTPLQPWVTVAVTDKSPDHILAFLTSKRASTLREAITISTTASLMDKSIAPMAAGHPSLLRTLAGLSYSKYEQVDLQASWNMITPLMDGKASKVNEAEVNEGFNSLAMKGLR